MPPTDRSYVNETHVLDTALLAWMRPYVNGTPPTARVGHVMVSVGAKIFVFGGAAGGKALKNLHVLDTSTMTWGQPPTVGVSP